MKSAILYMLITVTTQGDVHHSHGFKSLHVCEEAKSVVIYGKSIEHKAADEAKAKADTKARQDTWARAHPPRKPDSVEESRIVEFEKRDRGATTSHITCPPPEHPFHVTTDLLIQDDDPADVKCGISNWAEIGDKMSSGCNPDAIKSAECVGEVHD